MNFAFSKPLDKYTNDDLISLFTVLKQKLDAILTEGRKREMLYFLKEHEQIDLINAIFNQRDKE
ncbi:hypothetical protein HYU92_03610 [Candidatus Curtissbacteria bacterium]|nr:hypothetical protein [Candidatus Curtissbacteria bacterium]